MAADRSFPKIPSDLITFGGKVPGCGIAPVAPNKCHLAVMGIRLPRSADRGCCRCNDLSSTMIMRKISGAEAAIGTRRPTVALGGAGFGSMPESDVRALLTPDDSQRVCRRQI